MIRTKPEYLIFFFALLLPSACAKISSPTGGLRDRRPPVVVESAPLNGTKNFHGKKIEIYFDEFVVLDNINEKFMISPPMKKKPRVFMRGKSVNIEFQEPLRDSATYTCYFLDAIRDLNEGNVLDNYKFVFSTGNVIDSLSVTGNVYNAVTLEVPEKTIALLYKDLTDSAVIKNMPDYISRIDQTGYFRMDNLRPGNYKLYALKDDDNSKTYNRIEEPFAFLDSVITINPAHNYIPVVKDTIVLPPIKKPVEKPAVQKDQKTPTKAIVPPILKGEHELILFEAQKTAHYLSKSARDIKYRLDYILSLPPDSMKFEFSIPGIEENRYLIESNRNRDTMTVWLRDSALYSQPLISPILRYPFTDSLGITGYKQDTVPMRFVTPPPTRGTKKAKPKLVLENNIMNGLKPGDKIRFSARTPLREPDTSKIRLYEIVEKERNEVPYNFTKDPLKMGIYTMEAGLKAGKQYLFIADSASFSDIYNVVTDSTGIKFSIKDASSYGKLIINITNSGGSSVIQLLDKSEKLVGQKISSNDGKMEFPLLEKGTYRLRAIYDSDKDGKWTTGDYLKHRQPEASSYYPGETDIKENWVNEQKKWDLKVRNFKIQDLREKTKRQ